ncbi:hypothetical protein [Marinibactrum halimedae]|uniref:Uncharacterized protein n=1 Tax=Marinibactrum halimedae TaxID=1444977 RepID=A0AA37WLN0_9GAMM|nr:hypothetical protein [Marinibactrum halimedae]MCD9458484.1 hypothetical protein [Marinibactrum halimedae]GLS26179.1 hypothetical protein GCM10007877_18940 [Marinibactrum halimedae]
MSKILIYLLLAQIFGAEDNGSVLLPGEVENICLTQDDVGVCLTSLEEWGYIDLTTNEILIRSDYGHVDESLRVMANDYIEGDQLISTLGNSSGEQPKPE